MIDPMTSDVQPAACTLLLELVRKHANQMVRALRSCAPVKLYSIANGTEKVLRTS